MAVKLPSKLFIDSAALIAVFNKNDQHHKTATDYYGTLTKSTSLITTLLVVSETYTWFRYHLNHKIAIDFLDVVEEAIALEWLKIIYPDPFLNNQAQNILRYYSDQDLSYVDAVNIAVLQNMKIKDVFSFDSHFYIVKSNVWPMGY